MPAKLGARFLRVHLHATFDITLFFLLALIPTKMRDWTLVIFFAFFVIFEIGYAHGREWPFICVVAVKTFDAIFMLVACHSVFISDTDLLAITRNALARH